MSDEIARRENTLLNTDDAQVWAEEFCRVFNNHLIIAEPQAKEGDPTVDPGAMLGWFANAMQTAINLYERKKLRDAELRRARETPATRDVPQSARDAFVAGAEDGLFSPDENDRRGPTDLDDPTAP